MTEISNLILEKYQIRKSKKQKLAFIDLIKENFENVNVEESKGISTSRNIVIGDVKTAKTILTAHYDTPATMPLPNFLAPKNLVVTFGYQLIIGLILILIMGIVAFLASIFTDNVLIILAVEYLALFGFAYLLMAGKANKNNANDNTSGVITLIETMNKLSNEEKEKVAFVFFDNEELGLLGSRAFKKKYKKEMKEKLLINFDCVSDGDYFLIICNKKAENLYADRLKETMIDSFGKTAIIDKSSKTLYPSDQMGYPVNIGVAAFKKSKILGYYVDKIHTNKDIVFQKENIEFLSQNFSKFIELI